MAHSLHKLIKDFNLYGFRAPKNLNFPGARRDLSFYVESPHVGMGATVELIKLDSLAYSDKSLAKDRKLPPKTETGSKADSAAIRAVPPTDPIFDRWLERKLHELFDAVAHEPIPDDLIQLIVTLDKKDQKRDPS